MNKKYNRPLMLLICALIGGIIGFLMAYFGQDPPQFRQAGSPGIYKLSLLPIIVLVTWLAIGIHEMGHVLAGLYKGFEFRFISVGPTMWEKEGKRIKFKWNTKFNSYGGVALCLPKGNENLTNRFAFFAAGGPLASLLWGLASLVLLQAVSLDSTLFWEYFLDQFLFFSAILSFIVALGTILPFRSGTFYSDGARIKNLLSGGFKADVEATLLQHIANATAGVRPRLQDPSPIQAIIDHPEDHPMKPYFHAIIYYYYLDTKNLTEAEYHLKVYTDGAENIHEGYRACIWLENAWFQARFHKNAVLAKEYFQKDKFSAIIPKALIFRVEAAIAQAEGNRDLTISKANAAIAELTNAMDRGSAIAEREWLEELIEEADLEVV